MSTVLNVTVLVLAVALPSISPRPQPAIRLQNQFLYNEALRASLESMDRAWGKLNLTERGRRAPIDFHNMIVRKDSAITEGLNSQFDKYRVTFLDNGALVGRRKKLGREFAILVARPVDCPEGRLRITVDLLWVDYQRGRLQFGIDSWAEVYFRYDAVTGKYTVDNVELGGY